LRKVSVNLVHIRTLVGKVITLEKFARKLIFLLFGISLATTLGSKAGPSPITSGGCDEKRASRFVAEEMQVAAAFKQDASPDPATT
jgi:hypothetical protein